MAKRRKRRSAKFKFEVALEAAKGLQTASQIASEREVHPNQISQWKKQLLEEGASIFNRKTSVSVQGVGVNGSKDGEGLFQLAASQASVR